MAAQLGVAAIMGIMRFAASKGVQEAIKKYGKSAYNEALSVASKADKMGEQIRSQLNRLGKEAKAGLPAKIRNMLPSVTSQASRAPAIKGGRSGAVQKKSVEGEYIPKSQKSGAPSTESRRGSTYEGKSTTSGGGGGKEPPIYANKSDRFGGGRGQGPQGRMPNARKSAVAAGAVAGAAATSTGDSTSGSSSTSSYTIKRGDTLSAIARDSGIKLAELRDANPQIKDLNKIKPGQKIKVPKASIRGTGRSIYEGMTKAEMEKMAMDRKSRKAKGGMAKKSYAKGGYANCGASMKATQNSSKGMK